MDKDIKDLKIAVAGTGYVGLSIATLLSQHHQIMAVDVIKEKVELINNRRSPIQDDYIEQYLAEKELNLTATMDAETAYKDAHFVAMKRIKVARLLMLARLLLHTSSLKTLQRSSSMMLSS